MIQAGSKFGNYQIVRQLGAGGMSDVYEAIDLTLQRHVALKIMPPEFSRDGERLRRFRKEVLAVAALDHPGIVTIFEVNRAQGCDYYSMSLARHGNLKQLIHKGSLSPSSSLQIIRAVAEALGHAHEHGIVHRDIKPENILFARSDRPMLADFGIVKTLGSGTQITAVGTSVGTPYYMSPEQAQAISIDTRSDLYSLGVVLFEMLCGAVPFDATTTIGIALQHVNEPVPKLPGKLAALQPLVARMMAKAPSDRFQTAAELIKAIDSQLAQLAGGAPSEEQPPPPAAQVTRPPPAKGRSGKATTPPPAKPGKATRPPPKKSAAPAIRGPATEFDLMTVTPDPQQPAAVIPDAVGPAEPEDRHAQEPESPAPETALPGPIAEAPPEEVAPSPAPAGRSKTLTPPGATPPPPRRRRTPLPVSPPSAAPGASLLSRELYLRPGPAWHRRPLTYIIASAVAAIAAGVLLVKMSIPSREPTPVELITGRGPETPVIGATPDRMPAKPSSAPAPASADDDKDPAAVRIDDQAHLSATPQTDPSRSEFLDQLLEEQAQSGTGAEEKDTGTADIGLVGQGDGIDSETSAPSTVVRDITQPAAQKPAAEEIDVSGTWVPQQDKSAGRGQDEAPQPQQSQPVEAAATKDVGTSVALVTDSGVDPITELLAEAASLRSAARLSPPGENAWEVYQEVLQLEPGNREARAGIQAIESAYREQARRALNSGELDSAGAYLERLSVIAPTDPDGIDLGRQLAAARSSADPGQSPSTGQEFRDTLASGGKGPLLVVIGAGTFAMGFEAGDANERPILQASVPRFALGKYEVSREEYQRFVTVSGYGSSGGCNYWLFGWRSGGNKDWQSPGFEQSPEEPVVCVGRADAQAYADWLDRETGQRYSLPSESQWEYAAGGGATVTYWNETTEACRYANLSDLVRAAAHSLETDPENIFNCRDGFITTAPVGRFSVNVHGLADMLGNVGEWTADCFHRDYQGAPRDGSARTGGDCALGVARGGSWFELPANIRISKRFPLRAEDRFSHIGFRVARQTR